MSTDKSEMTALVSEYNRLAKIDAILNDPKRSKLGRRLAIENHREELISAGATSLEDPSNLKKIIGIAMMVTGFTIMAKVWASVSGSGPGSAGSSSNTGAAIATASENLAADMARYNELLSATNANEVTSYLQETVFKDDPKAVEKAKTVYDALGKREYYLALLTLPAGGWRGIHNRKLFQDRGIFDSVIKKMEALCKAMADTATYFRGDSGTMLSAIAQAHDDVFTKNSVELDKIHKAMETAIHEMLGETPSMDQDSAQKLASKVSEVNELFKPDDQLDAAKSADNLTHFYGNTANLAMVNSFEKNYANLVKDNKSLLTSIESTKSAAQKLEQETSYWDKVEQPKKDAVKKITDLAGSFSRTLNVMTNFSKANVNILKSLTDLGVIVEKINHAIKGRDKAPGTDSLESYNPFEISKSALFSRVPVRDDALESYLSPANKDNIDVFAFSDYIDGVVDRIRGNGVGLDWSLESLDNARTYCKIVGISPQSDFSDTYMARSYAVEDLSKAKKIGALLAILAAFGGLFALWKHFRTKKEGDPAATASIGETNAAIVASATNVANHASDLATQIKNRSFTGPDAEKNRAAVARIESAFRTIGIQQDTDEPAKIAALLEEIAKKDISAVYAKMGELGNLGVLSSRLIVEGPFGKGATSANHSEFFKHMDFVPEYLKNLAGKALEAADAYEQIVNKLCEPTISKTDVVAASAIKDVYLKKMQTDEFSQSVLNLEKYVGVNNTDKGVHEAHKDVLDAIRAQFERVEPKNIAAGVKAFSGSAAELAQFQAGFLEIGKIANSDAGLKLDTLGSKESHFSSEAFSSKVTTATANIAKMTDLEDKDKDVLASMKTQFTNSLLASRYAGTAMLGINSNVVNFVDKLKSIEDGLSKLEKAMKSMLDGFNISTGATTESFKDVTLPEGLSLEVFDDQSYLDASDLEYEEEQAMLIEQADLLHADATELEAWVNGLRSRRTMSREDASYIERNFYPALLTKKHPLATYTSFQSTTNYTFSLEESTKLAKGMKIAALVALAALAVRSAMWLKKKYEMANNSLAAITHLKDDLDKKIKSADSQAVALRQRCDQSTSKKAVIDIGGGVTFDTTAADSELKRLKDIAIGRGMAVGNWSLIMEEITSADTDIYKAYEPLRKFVLDNLDPITKTLEQIKQQVGGGQAGLTTINETEWKGIADLERAVGNGVKGMSDCTSSLNAKIADLNRSDAKPKTDADKLSFDDVLKRRANADKNTDGTQGDVESRLKKFTSVAGSLEQKAVRRDGDTQDNGAAESARAAQENLAKLKELVATYTGMSVVYENFYKGLDKGIGFYAEYIRAVSKKLEA